MVSLYYLVKLLQESNSRKSEKPNCHSEKPNGDTNNSTHGASESKILLHKCRVCLQPGNVPIFSKNTSSDLSHYLTIFTGIEISKDDTYPKYLCQSCLNSLEAAIEFRNTAKETQLKLKELLRHSINNLTVENGEEIKMVNSTRKLQIKKVKNRNYTKRKNTMIDKCAKYFIAVSVAEDEKPMFQCQICKKILKRGSKPAHFTLHHPPSESEFVFMCDVCGKTFPKRCFLTLHKTIHTKEFPFKCDLCSYKGRTKCALVKHKKVHYAQQSYMCTQCPRKFTFLSNLRHHLRRHEDPMFQCDNCDQAFYDKYKLSKHIETVHLGIKKKNVSCNMCGNTYSSRRHMLRHQIKVHNRKKVFSRALYLSTDLHENSTVSKPE